MLLSFSSRSPFRCIYQELSFFIDRFVIIYPIVYPHRLLIHFPMKICYSPSNHPMIIFDQVRQEDRCFFPRNSLLFPSALYPLNSADFPKQVLPDLHLMKIFRDIELLKENCEQRNLMVDINQLASDYQRWQEEKKEFRRLRDLHYIQEKLREQQANLSSTITDDNQNKPRKKKPKSNETKPTATPTVTTTTENM